MKEELQTTREVSSNEIEALKKQLGTTEAGTSKGSAQELEKELHAARNEPAALKKQLEITEAGTSKDNADELAGPHGATPEDDYVPALDGVLVPAAGEINEIFRDGSITEKLNVS